LFGMLSVLAELQRELIVANTRDGLAAARARGRRGGRPPKLTPDQVALAQRLYDAGEHTVAHIADMLGIPRSTIYGHLNKTTIGTRPHARKTAVTPSPPAAEPPPDTDRPGDRRTHAPASAPPTPRACPNCGHEPTTREEATTQRADTAVTWLSTDPNQPGRLLPRQHCRHCQPHHPVADIACAVCGMDPSSPATSPPRRPTPAPHPNPCSTGWPPTAGNSPPSCCAPTTERSPRHEPTRWCQPSRLRPGGAKAGSDDEPATVHAERPARDPALPCNPRAKTSGADHAHHVLPVLRVEVPQW